MQASLGPRSNGGVEQVLEDTPGTSLKFVTVETGDACRSSVIPTDVTCRGAEPRLLTVIVPLGTVPSISVNPSEQSDGEQERLTFGTGRILRTSRMRLLDISAIS